MTKSYKFLIKVTNEIEATIDAEDRQEAEDMAYDIGQGDYVENADIHDETNTINVELIAD